MLHPDFVFSYLLNYSPRPIPINEINPDWLEFASETIEAVGQIKTDLDATLSVLKVLKLSTDAHRFVFGKNGLLCQACFDDISKIIFKEKAPALAPWEEKHLNQKLPLWGLRLWEKST
jgi:hypothetical protein